MAIAFILDHIVRFVARQECCISVFTEKDRQQVPYSSFGCGKWKPG